MSKQFRFVVEGSARDGQTWSVSGDINAASAVRAFEQVASKAFRELTEGRAVYGKPGTCQGPYDITLMKIERVAVAVAVEPVELERQG